MNIEKSGQNIPWWCIPYRFRHEIILSILLVLLVILSAIFVIVMVSNPGWILDSFGLSGKIEALKYLGIGMSGVLLFLQALASYKRVKTMEDVATVQVKGQQQERLKNAIEHLGHQSDSVRMGGAYELFHLAKDAKELRGTAFEILCAHIRQVTKNYDYRKEYETNPSEEIQNLLTLLFVDSRQIFKGYIGNLQKSYLNGANLCIANMQGVILTGAYLQRTIFEEAELQGASLFRANLQESSLGNTKLQGSDLREAQLQGAYLKGTQLQGSCVDEVQLQGATLNKTNFQGVICSIEYEITFEDNIRRQIGKDSDLSNVIFKGGLDEQYVNKISYTFSRQIKPRLHNILQSHINKQRDHSPPDDSDVITGTYTKEEADEWIAKYKECISMESVIERSR